jgi:hypothetical protein
MKSITLKKLGLNSNLILKPLTVSTSKCRDNLLQQLVIILPNPLLKNWINWQKPPLDHWLNSPRQLRRTEV